MGKDGEDKVHNISKVVTCIFPAHSGRQETSSGGAGILSGKQSHLGSLIKSQAKIAGSSLYSLPFIVFLHKTSD